MVKHIEERLVSIENYLFNINRKLDRLLDEKAPKDRSNVEKETKDSLKLNDGKDVI